jgi:hypothetical protein
MASSRGNIPCDFMQMNTVLMCSLERDTQQCLTVDTIMISEFCDPTIFVPNAFTPNGNALNEVFMPVMTDVDEFQLLIYNRWGELVF